MGADVTCECIQIRRAPLQPRQPPLQPVARVELLWPQQPQPPEDRAARLQPQPPLLQVLDRVLLFIYYEPS